LDIHKGLPIHLFASQQEWLEWLDANHASASAVWVKFAKKGSGLESVTYDEAVNAALRYGWIDGLINKWDDTCYATRFTARKAKSGWSKVNREIVELLTEQNLMQPAGIAAVETAKADGRWDAAYAGQSSIAVPEDFQAALDANPEAAKAFDAINRANRYAFLYRIQTAAKPETRAARIEKFIAMLNAGEVFHPKKT